MQTPERIRLVFDGITTAAIVLAAVTVARLAVSNQPNGQGVAVNVAAQQVEEVSGLETDQHPFARRQGSPNVAIVEFADFQCPFCGQYARDTYPQLQREFVETGAVEYVFRNFPLEAIHSFAFKASEAAECAGLKGKYWEMHARLFENQQALAGTDLREHARAIGLSLQAFDRCLEGAGRTRVEADQAEARRLGVQSTPTFFIGEVLRNGRIRLVKKIAGAVPYLTFKTELDKLLVAKTALR